MNPTTTGSPPEPSYRLEEVPCDCSMCQAFAAIVDRHAAQDAQDDAKAREAVASGLY